MPGLRFVYQLALVVWLGGLLVLAGVAAAPMSDLLQARVPAEGRVLAAAVSGAILSRFHQVSLACGLVMVVALVVMALLGPRPRPYGPRLVTIGFMLAVTAVIVAPLGWHVQVLQQRSSGLLVLNAVGGMLLVFWDARERRS